MPVNPEDKNGHLLVPAILGNWIHGGYQNLFLSHLPGNVTVIAANQRKREQVL